ncbi:hypothetical protein F8M41_024238 [Gigaspora margarita]|uniref:Uncharacterized protein n=2 Tax=Gigaspora margarita TaxID=4874 RepID=A0A8H4AC25_GIGMA|nr:hypothetical protein F8M41_024238 [Gigaspora margarita]
MFVSGPINLRKHLYKRQQFTSLTDNTTFITSMIVIAAILGLLLIVVIVVIVLYRRRRNRRRISDSRLKPLQLVQNEPLLKDDGNSKGNKFRKDNRHSFPSNKNVRKFEIRLSMPVELAKPTKEYTYYQIESKTSHGPNQSFEPVRVVSCP